MKTENFSSFLLFVFFACLCFLQRLNSVLEDPKSFCVGLIEENRVKNRYEFIIPCKESRSSFFPSFLLIHSVPFSFFLLDDVNRVILSASSAIDASAYINASFIQVCTKVFSFFRCITQSKPVYRATTAH